MASSQNKQRKRKISQENFAQKEVVNTLGAEKVPSLEVVQPGREIHEVQHKTLMEQVVCKDNMHKAYRRVEQNNGAAGIDKVEAKNLGNYAWIHWESVKEQLLSGTYKPQPVRQVEIPKPDGGMRELGIPTVMDRMIQQALLQILTPIFDQQFSKHSYGFRPGRNAHQAVKRAQDYIKQGYNYVIDMDLEKFFNTVNHDILMSKLAKEIGDKRILKLIRNYLQAGIMMNGCCVRSEEGTPQGGPLSPLLANIMLHELDVELEQRGHRFIRYADDVNIYVKSQRAGERVMESIKKFVEIRLRLKVNEAKSAVDKPWNRKILGFTFVVSKDILIKIATKATERFKNRMRELTDRNSGKSMSERMAKLNSYLKGWLGYFYIAQTRKEFGKLDGWIRRRLRACLLKQWKQPKTKWRNLVSLGISKQVASQFSSTGKGCWRLSRTQVIQKALGLNYWEEQGLVSLLERYDLLWART